MLRHDSGTYYKSQTSATTFVFTHTEQEEYLALHYSEANPLKFLETKPGSELLSVCGKSKIRSHEIRRDEKIPELQQNVLVYIVDDLNACNVTHQMRLTTKYQYIPRLVKYGLLTSIIDFLGVLKNSTSRPVQTSRISITDLNEISHPFGGLPIGDSKYLESVAIAYYMLSARKLRVNGCSLSDLKVGSKRIISSNLLTLSEEDGPIDYLHIPLSGDEETLVIRIKRCLNITDACEKYEYVDEFVEQVEDGVYHTDFSRTRLYHANKHGRIEFHRNLADACSDSSCALSLCHPPQSSLVDATPVEDVKVIDFGQTFDAAEKLVVTQSPILSPKPQRLLAPLGTTILNDDYSNEFTIDKFRDHDDEAWISLGLRLDVIKKLPPTEVSLSAMMMRAAVLDFVG